MTDRRGLLTRAGRLAVAALAGAGLVWASSGPAALRVGERIPAQVNPGVGLTFVDRSTLACPGAEFSDLDLVASAVAAAPAEQLLGNPEDQDGEGMLRATDAELVLEFGEGERVEVTDAAAGSVTIDGTGVTAPGLVGGHATVATAPGGRGLSLTSCSQAAETVWLAAGGAESARTETLILTNPSTDPVTVDVDVWASDGQVPVTGGTGLVVPGASRVTHSLDAIAPGADAPVLRVTSVGGPVVAHLAEVFREGTTDRGADLVSALAEPGTDLIVPALPVLDVNDPATRTVTVRLVAPGEEDAVVELRALTETGPVPLTSATRVRAGHTVEVPLADLPAGAVALRMRSDEPITGAARLEVQPADDPLPEDEEPPAPAIPDDAVATTGPDDAPATAAPDDAAATAAPDDDEVDDQPEPIRHPAGEVTWVEATALSQAPVGIALPDLDLLEARVEIAVTTVDATTIQLVVLDDRGALHWSTQELANDSTQLFAFPFEPRAVWFRPTGDDPAGISASVMVTGADDAGPYVAGASLPTTPWQREVTQVRVLLP